MATDIIEKKKVTEKAIKEPGKYKVVICNDDATSIEFVISMLMCVFNHDEATATKLTMIIHETGSVIAGVYAYEIAEQKGIDATEMAQEYNFPLVVKISAE
jgi:ATP-dependent Clp protease adaptor protein ClpS